MNGVAQWTEPDSSTAAGNWPRGWICLGDLKHVRAVILADMIGQKNLHIPARVRIRRNGLRIWSGPPRLGSDTQDIFLSIGSADFGRSSVLLESRCSCRRHHRLRWIPASWVLAHAAGHDGQTQPAQLLDRGLCDLRVGGRTPAIGISPAARGLRSPRSCARLASAPGSVMIAATMSSAPPTAIPTRPKWEQN